MTNQEILASAWMTQQECGELFPELNCSRVEACGKCDDRGRDLIIAKTPDAAKLLEEHGHLYEDGSARVLHLSTSHGW